MDMKKIPIILVAISMSVVILTFISGTKIFIYETNSYFNEDLISSEIGYCNNLYDVIFHYEDPILSIVLLVFIPISFAISFFLVKNSKWRLLSSIGAIIWSMYFYTGFFFFFGKASSELSYLETYVNGYTRSDIIAYGEGFFIYVIFLMILLLSSCLTTVFQFAGEPD